jgi:hypothetical protein
VPQGLRQFLESLLFHLRPPRPLRRRNSLPRGSGQLASYPPDYWASATAQQQDIHFTVTNSLHTGYVLIAEWTCTYRGRTTGKRRELAGMFFADFYGNQVRAFREYAIPRPVKDVHRETTA